jgi:hypothetical protein
LADFERQFEEDARIENQNIDQAWDTDGLKKGNNKL